VSPRAQPLKGTFRTLSAWTDEQALASFARTDPHAAALRRIRPWTKSSTFRFWSVPVRELTSGTFSPAGLWADAVARVAAPESEDTSPERLRGNRDPTPGPRGDPAGGSGHVVRWGAGDARLRYRIRNTP
jgi:hypothetical protein